ncbi:hypothetical protein PN36_32510 [Candidatus Thiomargarita nelsonii]|uniref:Type I restriction enzyme HindI endonuclease subunit-like C-terminal domain-containing protein n=1 Tax=Candidatus Thiomargarita nelsonii TaxID=1003181 RepID=A0A0A6PCL1_9GAMM|nr:hypothetical protein PN36_32510 [Candidatus Thiomargarita nelsonii]
MALTRHPGGANLIDWTIKESVKAKLKVIVKRTLRQFGYPPDMHKLATETAIMCVTLRLLFVLNRKKHWRFLWEI